MRPPWINFAKCANRSGASPNTLSRSINSPRVSFVYPFTSTGRSITIVILPGFTFRDRFGMISSDSVTGLWNQIFGGIASASIGIVSVFLVIGGVVIMNIMLATVTERTQEIGLRKSMRARRRDILMQFVVESSVMSGVGGLLGVMAAVVVTRAIAGLTPMPMRTPLGVVAFSVAVSAVVGLFFGLWPAVKASRLDPVVALRSE